MGHNGSVQQFDEANWGTKKGAIWPPRHRIAINNVDYLTNGIITTVTIVAAIRGSKKTHVSNGFS